MLKYVQIQEWTVSLSKMVSDDLATSTRKTVRCSSQTEDKVTRVWLVLIPVSALAGFIYSTCSQDTWHDIELFRWRGQEKKLHLHEFPHILVWVEMSWQKKKSTTRNEQQGKGEIRNKAIYCMYNQMRNESEGQCYHRIQDKWEEASEIEKEENVILRVRFGHTSLNST